MDNLLSTVDSLWRTTPLSSLRPSMRQFHLLKLSPPSGRVSPKLSCGYPQSFPQSYPQGVGDRRPSCTQNQDVKAFDYLPTLNTSYPQAIKKGPPFDEPLFLGKLLIKELRLKECDYERKNHKRLDKRHTDKHRCKKLSTNRWVTAV